MAGLAIAALLPWLAWEVFVPPPLDVTAYKDTVDFDFRNPEYARKFAMLNDAEVE